MVTARVLALLGFGCVSAWTSAGQAEPTDRDREHAQMLFDTARAQIASGDVAGACANFRRSLELADGVGTRFNLADCLERSGRTASALRLFMDVASRMRKVGDSERAALAEARAERLEPRLARLAIETPRRSEELDVRVDGELIPRVLVNKAVPVDPGEHRVDVLTAGSVVWSASVDVREEAKTIAIRVPESALVATSSPPVEEPSVTVGTDPPAVRAAQAPRAPDEAAELASAGPDVGRTTAMFALGGASVVGLVGGAAMGLQYLASRRDADDVCSAALACTQADVARYEELAADMRAERDLALVGLGAGTVALAGALYLYWTRPSATPEKIASVRVEPLIEPGRLVGGSLRGSF